MQEAFMGFEAGDEWWFRAFLTFKLDGTFSGSGTDDVGDFYFKRGTIRGKQKQNKTKTRMHCSMMRTNLCCGLHKLRLRAVKINQPRKGPFTLSIRVTDAMTLAILL